MAHVYYATYFNNTSDIIFSQIVTGHMPLAKHLHRINKANSPLLPWTWRDGSTFPPPLPNQSDSKSGFVRRDTTRRSEPPTATEEARARPLNFIAHTTRLRSVFGNIPLVNDTGETRTTTSLLTCTHYILVCRLWPTSCPGRLLSRWTT